MLLPSSKIVKSCISLFFTSLALYTNISDACTRSVFSGSNDMVVTGRSMDWAEDPGSELWVFPRGVERNGLVNNNSPKWIAKYGSVVTSMYGMATADGINEAGLNVNLLYLAESQYGKPSENSKPLTISLWAQYVLDKYSTVNEAVNDLQKNPLSLVSPTLPNGSPANVHMAISDKNGDSAIIEYIKGKMVVHHGKEFQTLTNSPAFEQQLALDSYWKSIGGGVFMPGTISAADRFARAAYFIDAIPKKIDNHFIKSVPDRSYDNQAVASVLSVMRSVSTPLGMTTPNKPNVASTLWRVIADHKNLRYYFDSSTRPGVFWLDLKKIDFSKGASVKKLNMANGEIYAGEASKSLVEAKPYEFLH